MLQWNVKPALVVVLVLVLAAMLGVAGWDGLNFTW
jgi:hypothetical protein